MKIRLLLLLSVATCVNGSLLEPLTPSSRLWHEGSFVSFTTDTEVELYNALKAKNDQALSDMINRWKNESDDLQERMSKTIPPELKHINECFIEYHKYICAVDPWNLVGNSDFIITQDEIQIEYWFDDQPRAKTTMREFSPSYDSSKILLSSDSLYPLSINYFLNRKYTILGNFLSCKRDDEFTYDVEGSDPFGAIRRRRAEEHRDVFKEQIRYIRNQLEVEEHGELKLRIPYKVDSIWMLLNKDQAIVTTTYPRSSDISDIIHLILNRDKDDNWTVVPIEEKKLSSFRRQFYKEKTQPGGGLNSVTRSALH